MASHPPLFPAKFFHGDDVAAGYSLWTFASGTTTPKAAYKTSTEDVGNTHANPIILDAAGMPPVGLFLGDGAYTLLLETPIGGVVDTWDGIYNIVSAFKIILENDADADEGANVVGYNPMLAYAAGLGQFLNYTFGRTAAEIAAGVTPTNPAYLPGQPERYGAAADGTTPDLAAFTTGLSCNKRLILADGKTYHLGNVTSGTALFTVSGTNRAIYGPAAKITCTTVGTYNAGIFELDDVDGFTLDVAEVSDSGHDISIDFKGCSAVRLAPNTGPVKNVRIPRGVFRDLVSPIDATSAIHEASNIWLEYEAIDTHYGLQLSSNGHDLVADYRANGCVRSYFVVGVHNHKVRCVSRNHAARGNADFLIKSAAAGYPVYNLDLSLTSIDSLATTNPQLVFESQGAAAVVIRDVEVLYNDMQSTSVVDSIAFRHYDAGGGTLQPTDPNTKTGLRIRGQAIGTIEHLSTPTADQDQDFSGLGPATEFLARKNTSSLNVTGNGAVVDVVFDTEQRDTGGDYNAATGVFTAPRPGWYTFASQVLLADKTAAMLRADIKIVTTPLTFTNTATVAASSDYPEQAISISVPRVYMEAGDTAKVQVLVQSGAGNTADIVGDSIAYTYFSGGQA